MYDVMCLNMTCVQWIVDCGRRLIRSVLCQDRIVIFMMRVSAMEPDQRITNILEMGSSRGLNVPALQTHILVSERQHELYIG